MSEIFAVHAQWMSRPADQRYLTLEDLHHAVLARKQGSRERDLTLDGISIVPTEDGHTLLITDGSTFEAPMTHWAFGQMAQRVRLPAQSLREMPTELAALNLQWGLEHRLDATEEGRGAKLLLGPHDGDPLVVRAATSQSYGRIWDADVVSALRRQIGPEWKVPSASYAAHDPKLATTLYASDRDIFLFLVNETNPVEVPGTNGDRLFRGFYLSNSETGNGYLELVTFLYRYVCDNRIVWGASGIQKLRIRHNSQAPERFLRDAAPRLKGYLQAPARNEVDVIKRAMAFETGKDKDSVIAWLRGRGIGAAQAKGAYDRAQTDNLNPRSLWGAVQGLTSLAHEVKHTDTRVDRERDAGELLEVVSK